MTWRDRAACRGQDTDLWLRRGPTDMPVEAMRVCRGCPVRTDCLDEALTVERWADEGVWGGTTVEGRRKVRTGRMTRLEAMEQGDRIARRRTEAEMADPPPSRRPKPPRRDPASRAADLEAAAVLMEQVAYRHGMTVAVLVGPSRETDVVAARYEAMRLVRTSTGLPLTEIGRLFDRDHTTVSVAVRRAAA